MNTHTTADRQSLLDLGLQLSGSVEGAIKIAQVLNCALSDEVEIGTPVPYEQSAARDSRVMDAYLHNKTTPATALDMGRDYMGGIDFMGVEIDFLIR